MLGYLTQQSMKEHKEMAAHKIKPQKPFTGSPDHLEAPSP